MSLKLGLSDVFLIVRLRLGVLERMPQWWSAFCITSFQWVHGGHMTSISDVNLSHMSKGVFARLLHFKSLFPRFCTLFSGTELLSSAYIQEGTSGRISTYRIWTFSVRKIQFISPFIQPFVFISMDSCILYTLDCNPVVCYLFYYLYSILQPLGICSGVPFTCPHFISESPVLDTTGCSKLILCLFSLPNIRISHFSKEPWLLFVESGIQRPRSDCQKCLLLLGVIASSPSQQTELGNACIVIYIYTHISILLFPSVCICVYNMYLYIQIYKYEFILL